MAFGKKRRREMHAIGLRIEQLSIKAQPFAQIVDTAPRNSLAWKDAAGELARVAKESLDLARTLIRLRESSAKFPNVKAAKDWYYSEA